MEGGRVLICNEAPNLSLVVERGLSVSAASARKAPSNTIYLDGAAQSEPFLDNEKQVYNFDHHEGCVRQFTLSACEQVLVMVLKGFDLRGRDWKVFANEPDLDTVLAIWLLMNHVRIQQRNTEGLRFLNAMVRLEGIIDAHGLEMTALSGFTPNLMNRATKAIDFLRADEVELKKQSAWDSVDVLEYTASVLHKIDRLIYKADDFIDFKDLKELARVEIGQKRIAVVVDAEFGIYELERHLHRLYGESLGIVALRKDESTYTLRRLDPFMPFDLKAVYRRLNEIDPAVRCRTDGGRWGGSSDIGGSPRGMATQLTPDEIARACRDAFQKPRFVTYLERMALAFAVVVGVTAASEAVQAQLGPRGWFEETFLADLIRSQEVYFFLALSLFSYLCLQVFSRGRIWLYGLAGVSGKDWVFLFPAVLLSAAAGGVYLPPGGASLVQRPEGFIFVAVVVPLAVELLFRGAAHGILAQGQPVQTCSSRWFFSFPTVLSGLLYAAFLGWMVFSPHLSGGGVSLATAARVLFAGFAFGVSSGFVRERSQSLFPAVLFHGLVLFLLDFFD